MRNVSSFIILVDLRCKATTVYDFMCLDDDYVCSFLLLFYIIFGVRKKKYLVCVRISCRCRMKSNTTRKKNRRKKVKHLSLSLLIRNNDRTVANRLHGILVLREWHTAQDEMRIIWIKKRDEKKVKRMGRSHTMEHDSITMKMVESTHSAYILPLKIQLVARAKHSQNTLGPFERDRHPEIIFHWMTTRTANVHRHERIFSVCASLSEWLNIWRQMGYILLLCFFFPEFFCNKF